MCWPTPTCGATASWDDLLPPEVPVPALAEVQVALQQAAERVTGERGDALKRRLRTGTVVSYDDRKLGTAAGRTNGQRINHARAIAVRHGERYLGDAKAIACAFLMASCSASPTSRCTARSSSRGRPRVSNQRAVGEHLRIGPGNPRPAAQRAGARSIRASCAASTSRRSADFFCGP